MKTVTISLTAGALDELQSWLLIKQVAGHNVGRDYDLAVQVLGAKDGGRVELAGRDENHMHKKVASSS